VDTDKYVISAWGDDGKTLIRKTAITVDDPQVVSIATALLSENGGSWSNLSCNSLLVYTHTEFVSVYRMCSFHIDWIIVLSVPQWNYIGSTVIAVIAALVGSVLIVSIGVVMGVFVSLKIVKPFYNLIQLFESVSNMDLDKLEVQPSSFSEVKQLQFHFLGMVQRIKLYKSFIPAHLLSQLEGDNQEQLNKKETGLESEHESVSHASASSSRGISNSSSRRTSHDINKFSLYLEYRKVTLAQLHIDGLSEWMHAISPNDMVKMLSDVFDQVNSISRTSGGQVGAFENDSIVIAFNATTSQVNHEEKSVNTCQILNDKLMGVKFTKWKNNELIKKNAKLFDLIGFKFAVTCQQSCCGNIGSHDSKNFTIISSARHNLESLIEVARRLGVAIVVTEKVKQKCEQLFQMRYIDSKQLIDDSHFVAPSLSETITNYECKLYELGSSLKVEMDEVSITFQIEINSP